MGFRTLVLMFLVIYPAFSDASAETRAQDGAHYWVSEIEAKRSTPPLWDEVSQLPKAILETGGKAEAEFRNELAEIEEWNLVGWGATRNGFTRPLRNEIHVSIGDNPGDLTSDPGAGSKDKRGHELLTEQGDIIWAGSLRIDKAFRLRARLSGLNFDGGVKFWVSGAGGETVGPFGRELMSDDGFLWTPSVGGPELTIVALVPKSESKAAFKIDSILEIFPLDPLGKPLTDGAVTKDASCLEDVQCISSSTFSDISNVQDAIARITYVEDGSSYLCTGGLINDTVDDSWIPYFLTANHCIDSESTANSLEAFWDYKTASCGGSAPSLYSVPRTNGATLKVTSAVSDFTLLELSSVPSGRYFLGWDSRESAMAPGTVTHRISHPQGDVQHYSQMVIDEQSNWCSDLPRPQFIYGQLRTGATQGGSSGSPVLLGTGQIIGQLYGTCGDNIDNDCDYGNSEVDGSLNASWSLIAPFIYPQDAPEFDLGLGLVDAVDGVYAPGDSMGVINRVTNHGTSSSDTYRINFYASTNTNITSADHFLGYVDRSALGAGAEHYYETTVTIPESIPEAQYYIGAIIDSGDANPNNDSEFDARRVTIESGSNFRINEGLNGAWFNFSTSGQGILIDVLPDIKLVFLAWFTFDTSRPPSNYQSMIGEPGHRWLTAQGDFSGNRAMLELYETEGGVFNRGSPTPETDSVGTATLEFTGCNSGSITFSIPGAGASGTIPLQRLAPDNVDLCEQLNSQAQQKSGPSGRERIESGLLTDVAH